MRGRTALLIGGGEAALPKLICCAAPARWCVLAEHLDDTLRWVAVMA